MAEDNEQGKPSPLINPGLTRVVTEDAIYRATFLTSDDRKQEMLEACETAARQHLYFTADEIWEVLGNVGDDERDDGSGIGPVIRTAVSAGIMEATGLFRRSKRPPTHGKPLPIWKSLLRDDPDTAEMARAVEILEAKPGGENWMTRVANETKTALWERAVLAALPALAAANDSTVKEAMAIAMDCADEILAGYRSRFLAEPKAAEPRVALQA